jgi:1-acyl-sn-glycerol-3-phosphate acyltransferase
MNSTGGAGPLQRRTRRVVSPIANRLWRVEATGFDRLPPTGPAILCPNHISFFDSALLALSVPRNISFVGKAEYMDSWKTKYVFPALGMIPIDRSGGEKSNVAMDAAAAVLERGELFGIYPEGTRSRTGKLYKGRTGAARLAMRVGCPIYPVGIVGTDQIQPPGARFPRVGRSCSIAIGRPISPDRYSQRTAEHLAWRSMMDEVMFEIREMTGQTYVHQYAGEAPRGVTESIAAGRIATVTDISVPSTSTATATADGRELLVASGS